MFGATIYDDPVFTESDRHTKADEPVEADSITVMVYICGADLESEAGCATADITEMTYAQTGKNCKIIAQTGGAKKWQNSVVSSKTVERYLIDNSGLTKVGDAGKVQMTDSNQVADFINFAKTNYPADRYGFIFWDHGGGTIGGYGVDENFGGAGMSIYDIANGFEKAGNKFDFIGFDCCLMGTIEVANALAPYSDYLIASEEVEPGSGWYYTNFLTKLEENPGMPMKDLAKQIINDYSSSQYTGGYAETTLSLIDLEAIPATMNKLYEYMGESREVLRNNGYSAIAGARSGCRDYGEGSYEQIDIIDYISMVENVKAKDELQSAIQDCVLYNGTNISGSNGLAMYFPYVEVEYYSYFHNIVNSVGVDDDSYNAFFDDFVSLELGGHSDNSGNHPYSSESLADSIDELVEQSWFDEQLVEEYQNYYSEVDTEELEITNVGDQYVLQLSEEDWEIVTDISIQVWIDDGEGYLELGADNKFDWTEDGDLSLDYDNTWIYLNDCLVPYYVDRAGYYLNGSTYAYGYVPAFLNGEEDIKIWILWTEEATEILGYTLDYATVASKGYYEFSEGDQIDFFFTYYDYEGNYIDEYSLEDNTLIYNSAEGLAATDYDIGELTVLTCFKLTDIYQNEYWTQAIEYSYQ